MKSVVATDDCHDAFPHLPHLPLFVVSSSASSFFDGCLRACVDGLLGFSSCLLCLVLRRFKGFRCCSSRFKLFLLHARESLFLREFVVHQNSVSFLLWRSWSSGDRECRKIEETIMDMESEEPKTTSDLCQDCQLMPVDFFHQGWSRRI